MESEIILDGVSLRGSEEDEQARERSAVRWYVMTVPSCHRGSASKGLQTEVERRRRAGEPLFDFFAPSYVEVQRRGGEMVRTQRPLLFNYVFVHASECEIFRTKRHTPLYSFLPRVREGRREHYPYLSEEAMRNLQWVARSYSNEVPVWVPEPGRIVKGDKVRITAGQFKGAEATVVTSPGAGQKEIVVCIENWMWVPLLHVREGEYEVISLSRDDRHVYTRLDNGRLSRGIHEAMGRYWSSRSSEAGSRGVEPLAALPEEDRKIAEEVLRQYGQLRMDTDVMKIKLYSLLLPAYVILGDEENARKLTALMREMLDTVRAEQAKASLLVTLYGCTDSIIYHDAAHSLVDSWRSEAEPKKSKQILIRKLDDYDLWLGHKEI